MEHKTEQQLITEAYRKSDSFGNRAYYAGDENASEDELSQALQDKDSIVRMNAAGNKKCTKHHLDTAMKDGNEDVMKAAVNNPNSSKDHVVLGLNSGHPELHKAAMKVAKKRGWLVKTTHSIE